jgi:hypothetical protein
LRTLQGCHPRGMDPMQFLDDKTKEKALTEEMKNKYDTDRGTRGIIIKRINDVATQMAAKILACKLLRKCRKEEVRLGSSQLQHNVSRAPQLAGHPIS